MSRHVHTRVSVSAHGCAQTCEYGLLCDQQAWWARPGSGEGDNEALTPSALTLVASREVSTPLPPQPPLARSLSP